VKKKILSILFALVLVLSFSLVATTPVAAATPIYVNDTTGDDSWDGTSPTVSGTIGPKKTIQAGVNVVDVGGTVNVAAGTYNENVKITKRLTLTGAGPTTIIQTPLSTVGSLGVAGIRIMLAGCGSSETERTVISNLRITGGYNGIDTENFPDSISRTLTFSHITLENLQVDHSIIHSVDGYTGSGINVRKWSNYNDIIMNNITATDNAKFGIDFNAQLNSLEGLTVNGGYFANNGVAGLEVTTVSANNIIISGATFESNGLDGYDVEGDIVLSGPNGNIAITDVTINSGGASTGIRLSGPGTLVPAGTITLTDVTINGIQQQWPRKNPLDGYNPYPSGAIVISRFKSFPNIHFSNVNLNSIAPVGLFLGTITNTPAPTLDLTGISFDGTYGQLITLGLHGNNPAYPKSNVNVDARNAYLGGLTDNLAIENKITHKVDDAELGLVTWLVKSGSVTTTTNTGSASFTTSDGGIEDLTAVAPPGLPSVTFPHGMFSFKIVGLIPGSTVTLTITLPAPVPVGTLWWKYDSGSWYSLPNLSDNGDNIMVIQLTDGGSGDLDGIADGTITDPSGPGNPMTVGWDGSPVSKAAVLAPWLVLLAAIVAVTLLVLRRRRAQS